jgi:hypothetical protein
MKLTPELACQLRCWIAHYNHTYAECRALLGAHGCKASIADIAKFHEAACEAAIEANRQAEAVRATAMNEFFKRAAA